MHRNKVCEYYKTKAEFCKGSGGTFFLLMPVCYQTPPFETLLQISQPTNGGQEYFTLCLLTLPMFFIITRCCNSLNNKEDPETYKKPVAVLMKRS